MPLAGGGDSGRDESEVWRFFRQHFRDITVWSRNHVKDLIGLPFVSPDSQQPPFSVDAQQQRSDRSAPRDRYWTSQRHWQRGDPIVAIFTTAIPQSRGQLHAGIDSSKSRATRLLETATSAAEQELLALNPRRRQVINLPDGTTMLDMCYPGWEVAILPEAAMLHFWGRRWLFGDYYGHLLTGRTSSRMARGAGQLQSTPKQRDNPFAAEQSAQADLKDGNVPPTETLEQMRKRAGPLTEEQLLAAFRKSEAARAAQREAVFENRRASNVNEAAEAQQRRGVPFDAHPIAQAPERAIGPDELVRIEVVTQHIISEAGRTGRFSVRRTFQDGRTEVSDMTRSAAATVDGTTAPLDDAAAKRMRRDFDASFAESSERPS